MWGRDEPVNSSIVTSYSLSFQLAVYRLLPLALVMHKWYVSCVNPEMFLAVGAEAPLNIFVCQYLSWEESDAVNSFSEPFHPIQQLHSHRSHSSTIITLQKQDYVIIVVI